MILIPVDQILQLLQVTPNNGTIRTDIILCLVLSLVLTLSFIKSLGTKIDGDNSVEKQYGVMGSGKHLIFYTKNRWYWSFFLLLVGKSGMLS